MAKKYEAQLTENSWGFSENKIDGGNRWSERTNFVVFNNYCLQSRPSLYKSQIKCDIKWQLIDCIQFFFSVKKHISSKKKLFNAVDLQCCASLLKVKLFFFHYRIAKCKLENIQNCSYWNTCMQFPHQISEFS